MSDQSQSLPKERVCIATSTLGTRAASIALPPVTPGLSYLILVQHEETSARAFERVDVTCVTLDSSGLSHSRNSALEHCEARYLLVSDDDLKLEPNGILALADVLDNAPELAFVAGWRAGRATLQDAHRIRWFNAGHICAPELMIRLAAVECAGIRFDSAFGVGAEHPIGEDFIFVCDMLRAGLKGRSEPVITGTHPGASSGEIWYDPQLLNARKAMLRRCFGSWARLVQVIYAIRLRRRFDGWRAVLAFALTR